jgi:hypothetical protein
VVSQMQDVACVV